MKKDCLWQFPTANKTIYEMKQCIHLTQVIYILSEIYSIDIKRKYRDL